MPYWSKIKLALMETRNPESDSEALIIFFLYAFVDRNRHPGPGIAVIECPCVHSIKSGIRALNEFPCVSMPSNANDSQYQVVQFFH